METDVKTSESSCCYINIDYSKNDQQILLTVCNASLGTQPTTQTFYLDTRHAEKRDTETTNEVLNSAYTGDNNQLVNNKSDDRKLTLTDEYPVRDFDKLFIKDSENFPVSGFKLPLPPIMPNNNINYCCLDFDGTAWPTKRHGAPKCNLVKSATAATCINIRKSVKHIESSNMKKSKKKSYRKLVQTTEQKTKTSAFHSVKRNEDNYLQLVLSPREWKGSSMIENSPEHKIKKSEEKNHKKKIIVTSNTLGLIKKPTMKNKRLQTDDLHHDKNDAITNIKTSKRKKINDELKPKHTDNKKEELSNEKSFPTYQEEDVAAHLNKKKLVDGHSKELKTKPAKNRRGRSEFLDSIPADVLKKYEHPFISDKFENNDAAGSQGDKHNLLKHLLSPYVEDTCSAVRLSGEGPVNKHKQHTSPNRPVKHRYGGKFHLTKISFPVVEINGSNEYKVNKKAEVVHTRPKIPHRRVPSEEIARFIHDKNIESISNVKRENAIIVKRSQISRHNLSVMKDIVLEDTKKTDSEESGKIIQNEMPCRSQNPRKHINQNTVCSEPVISISDDNVKMQNTSSDNSINNFDILPPLYSTYAIRLKYCIEILQRYSNGSIRDNMQTASIGHIISNVLNNANMSDKEIEQLNEEIHNLAFDSSSNDGIYKSESLKTLYQNEIAKLGKIAESNQAFESELNTVEIRDTKQRNIFENVHRACQTSFHSMESNKHGQYTHGTENVPKNVRSHISTLDQENQVSINDLIEQETCKNNRMIESNQCLIYDMNNIQNTLCQQEVNLTNTIENVEQVEVISSTVHLTYNNCCEKNICKNINDTQIPIIDKETNVQNQIKVQNRPIIQKNGIKETRLETDKANYRQKSIEFKTRNITSPVSQKKPTYVSECDTESCSTFTIERQNRDSRKIARGLKPISENKNKQPDVCRFTNKTDVNALQMMLNNSSDRRQKYCSNFNRVVQKPIISPISHRQFFPVQKNKNQSTLEFCPSYTCPSLRSNTTVSSVPTRAESKTTSPFDFQQNDTVRRNIFDTDSGVLIRKKKIKNEIFRQLKPKLSSKIGSIYNSTYLFTKVNKEESKESSFQKRKNYYLGLKDKKRKKQFPSGNTSIFNQYHVQTDIRPNALLQYNFMHNKGLSKPITNESYDNSNNFVPKTKNLGELIQYIDDYLKGKKEIYTSSTTLSSQNGNTDKSSESNVCDDVPTKEFDFKHSVDINEELNKNDYDQLYQVYYSFNENNMFNTHCSCSDIDYYDDDNMTTSTNEFTRSQKHSGFFTQTDSENLIDRFKGNYSDYIRAIDRIAKVASKNTITSSFTQHTTNEMCISRRTANNTSLETFENIENESLNFPMEQLIYPVVCNNCGHRLTAKIPINSNIKLKENNSNLMICDVNYPKAYEDCTSTKNLYITENSSTYVEDLSDCRSQPTEQSEEIKIVVNNKNDTILVVYRDTGMLNDKSTLRSQTYKTVSDIKSLQTLERKTESQLSCSFPSINSKHSKFTNGTKVSSTDFEEIPLSVLLGDKLVSSSQDELKRNYGNVKLFRKHIKDAQGYTKINSNGTVSNEECNKNTSTKPLSHNKGSSIWETLKRFFKSRKSNSKSDHKS